MYDIREVAKEVLTHDSMTQKKLQKLCYYAQGWYLGITGKKLFNDEIQAWIHGPVSPILYNEYREYGYKKIPKESNSVASNELRDLINQIYRIYGELDGDQLEYLTHQEEPWLSARKGLEPFESSVNVIDTNIMEKYFKNKLNNYA